MKVQIIALLAASTVYAHEFNGVRHAAIAKRQTTSTPVLPTTSASVPVAGATGTASGATSGTSTAIGTGSTPVPPATGPYATLTASNAPALASITSGMPSAALETLSVTYTSGASPSISGAPVIPTFIFSPADWPAQDKVPETTSDEVKEWMKELDGVTIPDFAPTVDGSCGGDPAAAAEAAKRGWWTCGAYTRDTDIVSCPDKLTWGVSFDDGPSPYTPALLNYLNVAKVKSTFFVVGSRVISYPQTLVAEYMGGHEIAVHTWSHRHMTTLTNEQIVAELGWTRAAIKAVIGVTPIYMRPPYGDIDDRVRAICLAMGLIPIIWTRTDATGPFDTNDWKVAGGIVSGVQQYETFQNILGTAATLDTGFIVLAHDLYPETVDLAKGYTIPAALTHNPAFNLMAIGTCSKIPATNLYLETNQNTTFPAPNAGGTDVDGDGTSETQTKASQGKNNGVNLLVSLPLMISAMAFSLGSFFW